MAVAVLALFGLVVLGAVAVLIVLPRATHGSALTVLTGSMTPAIPVGSVVLDRPVDTRTLQVGDIATYQAKPGVAEFITHRIVRIDRSTVPASFIFKGDANRGADADPVPATAIRGRVWFHLPYLGAVRDALHGTSGLGLLAMLGLGGYSIAQFWSLLRERRRNTDGQVDPDTYVAPALVVRPMILVSLQRSELASAGGSPEDWAHSHDAILVGQDEATCQLLLAPAEDEVEAAVDLLRTLKPISLLVTERPVHA
ncbi:signal peptidase I [Nocardioides marmorisolisilvae]|uniref:signal peptidase I n=1 Tax=Nocardioides marmorisolisilvae TaxID=1542737 RepID=UPI001618A61B|nr:signal peptidase I [Nocardioides marmorisolisilvae]